MIAVDYLGPQNLFLASTAGATWTGIGVSPSTLTITGATNITSTNGAALVNVPAPTFTSASALTLTNAATLLLQGAPIAAGSLTITNAYTLAVQSGAVQLGTNVANATTASVFTATSGPASAHTAIQEWFLVYNAAGTARYIPCW